MRTQNDEHGPESSREITLGLVSSPDHAERLVNDIAGDLPALLADRIDAAHEWKLEIVVDPLTGTDVSVGDVLESVQRRRADCGWDFAVMLTDLPIRRKGRIVIAGSSDEREEGFISIPALGAPNVRSRLRDMILQLMEDLHNRTPYDDTEHRQVETDVAEAIEPAADDAGVEVRYTAPRIRGHMQLLLGMVYANRPWRLFPSFKTTVATAFATGGYGLIFTTLWEIGNAYGMWRQLTLMLVAMAILVTWIIVSHELWQPHRHAESQYLTSLYNTVTVLTISAGVVVSYVAIFLLLLFAASIYIPTPMLEDTIGVAVTPFNFVKIAWVTASVATIAGAVGAGLEDSDAVRDATFGWRQRHRWEAYRRGQDEPGADASDEESPRN